MGIPMLRCIVMLTLVLATPAASASFIILPHTAGRDAALNGNTVATPMDGSSALFINPAGVAGTPRDETLIGVSPLNFTTEYSDPGAAGYRSTSSETAVVMNAWHGLGQWRGWSLGVGSFGSVGTAFELASDPDIGQTSPFTGKLTVLNIGLNAGRQLTQDLRVGFQIAPRYGKQTLRTPSPAGDVDFDVDGFGIAGAAGLVYEYSDRFAVGLAYQSPGIVDMDGDGTVGGNREDVEVELITPQRVTVGVAYEWRPDLRVMAQARWTDYNDFERGDVDFEETSSLDQPFIPDAKPRIRWGFALEHEVVPNSWLRAGFSYESWMIERSSLRPYFSDYRDIGLKAGYEIRYETISLGFNVGYNHLTDRSVDPATNPVAPGDYRAENDMAVAGFMITWHR